METEGALPLSETQMKADERLNCNDILSSELRRVRADNINFATFLCCFIVVCQIEMSDKNT